VDIPEVVSKSRVVPVSLLVGALSCVLGTAAIFISFFYLIHGAERWSGAQLLNDTPLGMFEQNRWAAASAIVGMAAAWFAFGFFITYSQLSSRDSR
jgi:hypothetical protein